MKRMFHVMVNVEIERQLSDLHNNLEVQGYSDYIVWTNGVTGGGYQENDRVQREKVYSEERFRTEVQQGDIICWLNAGEKYAPGIFRRIAEAYEKYPGIDLIYGDDFQLRDESQTYAGGYHYKPAISECFLSNYNYIGNAAFVLADAVLDRNHAFGRSLLDNNYGILLDLSKNKERCLHIPEVFLQDNSRFLEKKQKIIEQEQQALREHFGSVISTVKEIGNRYILEAKQDFKKVSVIIFGAAQEKIPDYLKSLSQRTDYPVYEFVVMAESEFCADGINDPVLVCVCSHDEPPAVCIEKAVKLAGGEYYIFLNAKILPGQNDWIQRLLDGVLIYGAGAVSPLILNEDMSVYHAGVKMDGGIDTAYKNRVFSVVDDLFYNQLDIREAATVADAVVCIHKSRYANAEGVSRSCLTFEEALTDLGFRLRVAGDCCVYTPFSCMVNTGRRTTVPSLFILKQWGKMLAEDVFFTPQMLRKYFSPQIHRKIYAIGSGRGDKGTSIAILAGDIDDVRRREKVQKLVAELGPEKYICIFSHKQNSCPEELVAGNVDVIEDSTLLLGTKSNIALLKQFDEILYCDPVYVNIQMELESKGTFDSYFGVKCTPQIEYNRLLWDEKIDIIVPVYNGYEYLEKLFDSIPRTRMNYRLIIVNDCSPDERIAPFLEEVKAREKEVIYIEHQENQGFVCSVNDALRKSEGHVAIVNTDVEVPEEWLERLMTPIILERAVASTTPFTNSGSICSFPEFAQNNAIFMGKTVKEIDDVFKQLLPRYYEIPTGVGFCMGMSKHAIREIGVLDAETFGKGYGEENDWCVRAIEHGYRNVQVNNLFVYHKHGGTFLPAEKQALLQKNLALLGERHIYFHAEVARFERRDPYRRFRLYAEMKICMDMHVQTTVYFSHNWAGGAISYLQKQKRELVREKKRYIGIYYDESAGSYLVEFAYGEYNFTEKHVSQQDLYVLLQEVDCQEIILSELISFPRLFELMEKLLQLKTEKKFRLKALVHDFYCLCPSYTLTDNNFCFCALPEEAECIACAANNTNFGNSTRDIVRWRKEWSRLLQGCDEVICFSEDSRHHLDKVYEGLSVAVVPHEVEHLDKVGSKRETDAAIYVGIIGAINEVKGLNIIEEMAAIARNEHSNIHFVIIGYTSRDISCENVRITGKYKRDELPGLLEAYGIDIVLIPSVWPETFSYTTQEAIMMDVPLAVFNIGAPVERVSNYQKGIIIEEIDARKALDVIEDHMRENRT